MADRFLRQRLIVRGVAEYPSEPTQCGSEVAAKPCRQSKIVRDQPDIFPVRLLLCKLERETELLLGLRPFAFADQAKPARVPTFHGCFAVFGRKFFGLSEKIEGFADLTATTG